MDEKVQLQMQGHWENFEKKWENTIVQLEPGGKKGWWDIAAAEHRIRMDVQKDVDKNWRDRMANEDKLTTSKIESLRSIVEELEREVTTLKIKNSISAASTVATSSGSGGSNIGAGFPGGQSFWIPTRVELKGCGVCKRIRENWYF